MKHIVLCASLLFATLPVAAQEDANGWARLVPKGTVAVAFIPSVAKLETAASEIGKLFGAEEQLVGGLAMARMQLGPLGGDALDTARPIIIAVEMPADGGMEPPMPVLILPVKDVAAVQENMPGIPTHAGWVGMSMGGAQGEVLEAEAVPALVAGLGCSGLAKVRVDLGAICDAYGAMMIGGLEMGVSQIPMDEMPPGVDIDGMIDSVLNGVEDFIDSAKTMEMELGFSGGHASFTTNIAFRPDSVLGKACDGRANGLGQLLSAVDGNYPITMASTIDLSGFMAWYMNLMKTMTSEMPPGMMPPGMDKLFGEVQNMMGLVTGRMAAGFDLGQGGMKGITVSETTDAGKYLNAVQALLGSELYKELGVEMSKGEVREVEGLSLTPMTMSFGESMREQLAAGAPPEVMGLIDRLMGKGGMKVAFGAAGRFAVQTMNCDDAAAVKAAKVLTAQGGAAPARHKEILALGGTAPSMVMDMDLGRVLAIAAGIAREMGEEEAPDPASIPSVKAGIVMGTSKGAAHMGWRVDLAGIGKIVKILDR